AVVLHAHVIANEAIRYPILRRTGIHADYACETCLTYAWTFFEPATATGSGAFALAGLTTRVFKDCFVAAGSSLGKLALASTGSFVALKFGCQPIAHKSSATLISDMFCMPLSWRLTTDLLTPNVVATSCCVSLRSAFSARNAS